MRTDAELLKEYADSKADSAFTELVGRHLNLVYFAALRRTNDPHAAQDVTQQVFTIVAGQAQDLARHRALTGWLYTTTRFTAAKWIRAERRRKDREKEAHLMSETETSADWSQLRPAIDDALEQLDARDREAVLLRHLQQRSYTEIGTALELSYDATRMRVERATEKFRGLLAKRGLASTSAALAAVLAAEANASVPIGLRAAVTAEAMTAVSAGTGLGYTATALHFMSTSKTGVAVILAAIAGGFALYQSVEARAANANLAAARIGYQATWARFAKLQQQMQVGRRSAPASASSAASSAPVANNNPAAELQQRVNGHPEMRAARAEAAVAAFRARVAPFLRSIGFSSEQIAEAIAIYQRTATSGPPLAPAPGALPRQAGMLADYIASFRVAFGEAAAAKLEKFEQERSATAVVNDLTAKLYYADSPLTTAQARQLIDAIKAATAGSSVNWDKVFVSAANAFSPVQMNALRAEAAYERSQGQLAAIEAGPKAQ